MTGQCVVFADLHSFLDPIRDAPVVQPNPPSVRYAASGATGMLQTPGFIVFEGFASLLNGETGFLLRWLGIGGPRLMLALRVGAGSCKNRRFGCRSTSGTGKATLAWEATSGGQKQENSKDFEFGRLKLNDFFGSSRVVFEFSFIFIGGPRDRRNSVSFLDDLNLIHAAGARPSFINLF